MVVFYLYRGSGKLVDVKVFEVDKFILLGFFVVCLFDWC